MMNDDFFSGIPLRSLKIRPVTPWRRISAGALIIFMSSLGISGCMDYSRRAQIIDAPRNCRWQAAHVDIRHVSGQWRGSDMGPRYSPAHNVHTLVVKGETSRDFLLSGDPASGDYRLEFAPDCRALAVSQDKGLHYRFVFLDSEKPFLCTHLEADAAGGDFWRRAPSTREAVLQILRSSTEARFTRGINHAVGYGYGRLVPDYGNELLGALTYAVRNGGDMELRMALLEFMSLPGDQGNIHRDFLKKEVPALMDRHNDMKLRALEKLGDVHTGLLAEVLASHPDPAIQEMIARKLDQVYRQPASDRNCDRIGDLSMALVVKTAYRKTGDPLTVRILTDIFRDPRCPLRLTPRTPYDYKEVWSIRGENIRIHALKGLAAAGTPEAVKVLKGAAVGKCFSYQRTTMGTSDTVSKNEGSGFVYGLTLEPDKILGSYAGTHNRDDIACYAQALMKILGQGPGGEK